MNTKKLTQERLARIEELFSWAAKPQTIEIIRKQIGEQVKLKSSDKKVFVANPALFDSL